MSIGEDNLKKKQRKAPSSSEITDPNFYKHVCDAIFSQTTDLIYLLDKNGSLIDCNSNFMNLVGLTELGEKTVGYVYTCMKLSKYWSEKQIQAMKTKNIDTIVSGKPMLNQPELPVIDQNEEIHHYIASRIPIFNNDQELIALLVVLKEITAQKIMEEQFEKITLALEQFNKMDHHPIQSMDPIKCHEVPHEPLRILVVDDDPLAQMAAKTVLMQLDCIVDIAANDKKAIELFVPGKYNMVFMDIFLEEKPDCKTTGYMLTKQLREIENDTGYHVPMFALTSRESARLDVDCYDKKIEGAMTKPLTLEQARQLIQHYIHNIDVTVTGLTLAKQADYMTTGRNNANTEREIKRDKK